MLLGISRIPGPWFTTLFGTHWAGLTSTEEN